MSAWRCSTGVTSPAWRGTARWSRPGAGGDARSAWSAWSRRGAAPRTFAMLALTTGTLVPRLLARRADPLDLVVLAVRLGTLVGTAHSSCRGLQSTSS